MTMDRPPGRCVVCALPLVGVPSIVNGTPTSQYVSFRTIGSVCANCILIAANHIAPASTFDLEWLIAFCEQTARDGVLPSLAWFTETAERLLAAITNADRSTRNVSDVSEVLDNVPD